MPESVSRFGKTIDLDSSILCVRCDFKKAC